jgi:hypothetical protein
MIRRVIEQDRLREAYTIYNLKFRGIMKIFILIDVLFGFFNTRMKSQIYSIVDVYILGQVSVYSSLLQHSLCNNCV